MLNEFQKQLMNEKEKCREFDRLKRERDLIANELRNLEEKEALLKKQLDEEQVDVDKLEGFSLAGIFMTIVGKKEDQLDQEKQEVAKAHLKWKEAKEAKRDVESELTNLEQRINQLGSPHEKYEELLMDKQEFLKNNDYEEGERGFELLNSIADLKADVKEINEALEAGSSASRSLSSAQESLNKAKNWGTLDMFGGGVISTSIKHSNMDTAKEEVHRAQTLLRKFAYELDDIGHTFQVDLSISGGLTFMDYFFDGLISDWLVQDKINHSSEQVDKMYRETNRTLDQLKRLLNDTKQTIKSLELEWQKLVELAN